MILVRNQIRDMLGEETGKITLGKLSIILRLREIKIPTCVRYTGTLGQCGPQGSFVKFMTVFVTRRDSAYS